MSSSPDKPNAIHEQFAKAQQLQFQGKESEALAQYRAILEVDNTSIGAWHQLAQLAENQSQFSEAIEYYQKSIALDPEPPFWVYRHLGFALDRVGHLDEAIVAYQKALSLNPEDSATYSLLGKVQGQKEDIEGAISSYESAIKFTSNVPIWVYLNLAEMLHQKDRFDSAISAYKKAIRLEPKNGGIQRLLEAVIARKEAVEMGGMTRAKHLQSEGKLAEALTQYQWVLARDGSNLVALHQVAKICELQGKWDEAVAGYKKVLEVDAQSPFWVYRHLGFSLSQQGDCDSAIAAYQKALDLNPEDADSHSLLGEVRRKLGDIEGAIFSYQQAINLDAESSGWVQSSLNELLHHHTEPKKETSTAIAALDIQTKLDREPETSSCCKSEKLTTPFPKQSHEKWLQKALKKAKTLRLKQQNKKSYNLLLVAFLFSKSGKYSQLIFQQISESHGHTNLKKFIEVNQYYLKKLKLNSIVGVFEKRIGNAIEGWAFRWENLNVSVKLDLTIGGQKIKQLTCNGFNPTLKKLGLRKGEYGFEFTIPDRYLDGKEYRMVIQDSDTGAIVAESNYQLELKGHIDQLETTQVAGWVFDLNSQNSSLELDIYVNGLKYQSIVADLKRDDVGEIFGFSDLGFCVNLGTEKLRGREIIVTLKQSHIPILETPRIAIDKEAQTHTLSLLSQKVAELSELTAGEKQWLTKILLPNLKKLARQPTDDVHKIINQSSYHQLTAWKTKQDVPLNVIVPVYRNLKVTRECLERVISCHKNRPYQVTVINDCSPEPEIHTYLEQLASTGKINLIVHKVNQGFPASVNDGMLFDVDADVVLLNSDAYVTDYWLDRLRSSVYKEEKIATGTAFSNNATIFSYPVNCQELEDIPEDLTLEELAQVFYEVNGDRSIKVPTGHGFCLYIRRDALKEVGYFDAETWGKGYGEEVDWCQKALDLGWHHIAATGVFVQHVGSQSFTGDKTDLLKKSMNVMREKYPEYDLVIQDFIKSDPFAEVRRNVDIARLQRYSSRFILMLNHNLGGGTERHFKDLANILESEQTGILMLKPDPQSADWLELTSPQFRSNLGARYAIKKDLPALIRDLQSLGVFHIHIHHIIGFSNNIFMSLVKGLRLTYDVTLHDYSSICPRVTLSLPEGNYCQEPPPEVCEVCIDRNGTHESFQTRYQDLGSMKAWRFLSKKFLQNARKIFVPSEDMARRMMKYFPQLDFLIRPHPENTKIVTLQSQNQDESTVRVGLIGGISSVKGLKTLYDCATFAARHKKDIEFVVIGTTANNALFKKLHNVTIYGAYQPEELPHLIAKTDLDFAAFFSTWPETYCYTLSEALENNLYPFAFDIGAVGERVSQLGVGYLIDPEVNVAKLVEALCNFGHQCRTEKRRVEIGNEYGKSILDSYYSLTVKL